MRRDKVSLDLAALAKEAIIMFEFKSLLKPPFFLVFFFSFYFLSIRLFFFGEKEDSPHSDDHGKRGFSLRRRRQASSRWLKLHSRSSHAKNTFI